MPRDNDQYESFASRHESAGGRISGFVEGHRTDQCSLSKAPGKSLAVASIPSLETLTPALCRTLDYAALLPPDHVSLSWLKSLVTLDFPELSRNGRFGGPWEEVWRRLLQLEMLRHDEDVQRGSLVVRIPHLVRDLVVRGWRPEERVFRQRRVDALISDRCTRLEETKDPDEPRSELESLEATANFWADTEHNEAARLLGFVSGRWCNLAEWTRAETTAHRALSIDEKLYGADHPHIATGLQHVARILQARSRNQEADVFMRRATEIDERYYGTGHPKVAVRLQSRAELLFDTNRHSEAESLMRLALQVDEKWYGREHPRITTRLRNLAALLQATGQFADAELQMRRVLSIDEKSYGNDHPFIVDDLGRLAELFRSMDRLAEAEPVLRRIVEILLSFGRRTGHEHPDLQSALANHRRLLSDISPAEVDL